MGKAPDEVLKGIPALTDGVTIEHVTGDRLELAVRVCDMIGDGWSMKQACQAVGLNRKNFYEAIVNHVAIKNRYATACELRHMGWADEIVEIADDGSNDWMMRNAGDNPGWLANGEHIARSRLRSDTRRWLLSKLEPTKYGEKQQVAHSVNGTVTHEHRHITVGFLQPRQEETNDE